MCTLRIMYERAIIAYHKSALYVYNIRYIRSRGNDSDVLFERSVHDKMT